MADRTSTLLPMNTVTEETATEETSSDEQEFEELEELEELDEELIIEDFTIDGICGVY